MPLSPKTHLFELIKAIGEICSSGENPKRGPFVKKKKKKREEEKKREKKSKKKKKRSGNGLSENLEGR